MKKKICFVLCIVSIGLLGACNNDDIENKLKEYGITDTKTCDNIEAVEKAGKGIIKDKGSVYCAIEGKDHLDQANAYVKKGYSAKRINEFFRLTYYDDERTNRYIAFDNQKMASADIVTYVNIGLDQPYFSNVAVIKDTQSPLLLINKYHRLPDNYEPENLVETPNACLIGKDYSCQSEPQFLKKEVAEAFSELVEAAKKDGIDVKAIASYRSYAYQKNLYDYYEQSEGAEYADTYYARPGQSEHNSALAVDVTLNDENFNEIEKSPDYDWLLNHISEFGFIVRYPEDKVDITGYQYESWHLRYVGKKVAQEITEQGLTLDEYIARKKDI